MAYVIEPDFDIFQGTTDKDARWIEAVSGLTAARERMERLAAELPGQYFVFSQRNHAILARVDSRKTIIAIRPIRRNGKIA